VAAGFLGVGLALACLPWPTREGFFEGGISKGPPASLSYYAVSVGLSVVLLIALNAWGDRRVAAPVVAVGRNPLLAYYAIHCLLGTLFGWAIFGGRSLDAAALGLLPADPWSGFAWGCLKTAALAAFVWACTRARLTWRV